MKKIVLILSMLLITYSGTEGGNVNRKDTAAVKKDSVAASYVELRSFAAEYLDKKINLSWETDSEKDNRYFVIEKAVINGEWDRQNPLYKVIGEEKGSRNSKDRNKYTYQDNYAEKGSYLYRLKFVDMKGEQTPLKTIEVDLNTPFEYELEQNYPNPFNPETSIKFTVPKGGHVSLSVFNTLGQQVKTLVNEYKEPGTYSVTFNAEDLNSGLYFYRMESNDYAKVRKMTILK